MALVVVGLEPEPVVDRDDRRDRAADVQDLTPVGVEPDARAGGERCGCRVEAAPGQGLEGENSAALEVESARCKALPDVGQTASEAVSQPA